MLSRIIIIIIIIAEKRDLLSVGRGIYSIFFFCKHFIGWTGKNMGPNSYHSDPGIIIYLYNIYHITQRRKSKR